MDAWLREEEEREKEVTVIVVLLVFDVVSLFALVSHFMSTRFVPMPRKGQGKFPKVVFVVYGAIAKFSLARRKIDVLD